MTEMTEEEFYKGLPTDVHLTATINRGFDKDNYRKQLKILKRKAREMEVNNYKNSEYSVILFKDHIDVYSPKNHINMVIWLKEP